MYRNLIIIASLIITMLACNVNGNQTGNNVNLPSEFGDYWYQGKAELANYDLLQVRYGEVRNGHAVLIFVTEDFSKNKQVKLDNPSQNQSDVIKVLKLNSTRKFTTGIYPYSTMTSVFTPVYFNENKNTVKLTTTSQEWCGHTFLQANLKGDQYKIHGFSYFESEGDLEYAVENVLMEDEVWSRLRLNPNQLPTGEMEMLPGSLYCRFKHIEFRPSRANVTMNENEDETKTYEISYPDLQRTLKIHFNTKFPFQIQGWEETYPVGGQLMTTKANLKKAIQLDYWNNNSNDDAHWREELGL